MMTKDSITTSAAPSLESVSPQGAVLVTLPTSATAGLGANIIQGGIVKEETDGDLSASLAVSTNGVATISNVGATHTTLQSLLAAPVSAARVVPSQEQTIQVITLPTASDLITTSQPDGAGRVWQVVPSIGNGEMATIIAVADPSELIQATKTDIGEGIDLDIQEATELPGDKCRHYGGHLDAPTAPCRLPFMGRQNAQLPISLKIGESYRGYVESEVELDLLLTYHKQQTSSFWGTRQSPSPAKPSTRLMWKSQYVPFDGIPFVNIGSRAVVMECQYGPRRKGNANKRYRDGSFANQYCKTCPARIYIKRVRKFPEYAVDLRQDKKALRSAMDKAFHELREQRVESWPGSERFYVQLPTIKAHEYHDENPIMEKKEPVNTYEPESTGSVADDPQVEGIRLHPKVVQKLRSIVASGETRVYTIRKMLRAYVLREMFAGSDIIPERHDLTLFPTVNDLKNHLHQAFKDIENGTLGVTATTVNVEILPERGDNNGADLSEGEDRLAALLDRGITPTLAMPETVTVTLTQNPDAEGHHIISRIETHLSDGTTQVSTTLTPETAQLLSKLHPAIFPADSLMQLGSSQTSEDLSATATNMNNGEVVDGASLAAASSQSTAAGLPAAVASAGMEESVAEMQIVSPEEACSQLLQASGVDTQTMVPVQMPVAGEDGSLAAPRMEEEDGEKVTEGVLVSDADLITVSMADDSQLVLTAPVSETFESQ
ncbi:calcium-responsive transcription factor-like [Babylonia areolata]|uniref:calcium-responsive transcription factor-like n=1 Tax=Babylonia areolata TaxID=304850 RepID=UPI003FD6A8E9